MRPTELVTTVSPSIAALGSSFYFTDETVAVGREAKLGGRRFYFLGRGAVMGDVHWRVVHAAFGYFAPTLIESMWESARAMCPPAEAARLHLECCRDHGRARFAALPGLDAFCRAAEAVVEQAAKDPSAAPLFAGYAAQPLPDDLPGRAMQLTATLREHRGSAHLVAVVATGLPTPLAHRIKRPDFLELFGWDAADLPEPSGADRARLADAEALTDELVTPAYAVLDEAGAGALAAGVAAMAAARS